MKSITVIIPSRSQPRQAEFLSHAIASVRGQTIASQLDIRIVVAVDKGRPPQGIDADRAGFTLVESAGASQASALNAGMKLVRSELVAILEDDDQWHPLYLHYAISAAASAPFVSSNQLELDESGQILRINDFPTPSGWLMTAATMKTVGFFNEGYRWHLDNEWLGRLRDAKIPRIHMVEATAPVDIKFMQEVRPWLWNIVGFSGGLARIVRHEQLFPMVRRLIHSGSGTGMTEANPEFRAISDRERKQLADRFGHVPW